MADQEGEVELFQDGGWNNSWVTRLGVGIIRIWGFVMSIDAVRATNTVDTVDNPVRNAIAVPVA